MINPVRLLTIGIGFLALFAALVLRLWFLQIASGQEFADTVAARRIIVEYQQPARGDIRDASGHLLAGSRSSLSIVLDRSQVDSITEEELVQKLAVLLEVEQQALRDTITSVRADAIVTVARDITDAQSFQIAEYPEDFPGIEVALTPVRVYPYGATAAHLLGYVSRATVSDLDRYRGRVNTDDAFGRAGVERQYDNVLRGMEGTEFFQVNEDESLRAFASEQQAEPGWSVGLTIDVGVQQQLEKALVDAIARSEALDENPTGKAAGVVLDATNGEVVAMASLPAYDPNIFVSPLSATAFEEVQESDSLLNLAVRGTFPPGSTFKVVPYVVAVEEEVWPEELNGPNDGKVLEPRLEFPGFGAGGEVFTDWSPNHGYTDLHGALIKSADVYFWEVALKVWRGIGEYEEDIIQEYARLVGYGEPTGIDLPGEAAGIMPDREWRERLHNANPVAFPNGEWYGGDLMNTVIGQGDMVATPLQLAVSYAALVNGGTVWRPQVVNRFWDADGTMVEEREAAAVRKLDLDFATTVMLRQDLAGVVAEGTAAAPFADSPYRSQIGGKTGTAQIGPASDDLDTAWFVGVAPIANPRYVVVVVVDLGGGGSTIAAPAVRQVLEYILDPASGPPDPPVVGLEAAGVTP